MGEYFYENLKLAREQKGLSQKDVAEKIGVAKSTYSLYESGNREPNVQTIKKIANVLDVSADELLGIDTEPTTLAAHFEGDEYTEDELAAFYESLLEPLALQMSLEFSRKCGADVHFTSERLEFSSARTRVSLLRELLPFGVISINEARKLLALPEVEDGDKRLQSLNYVTADKADVYQEVDNHEQTA